MDNNEKLTKAMSPAAVWALAVGSIIGFGCFMLPPEFLPELFPAAAGMLRVLFLCGSCPPDAVFSDDLRCVPAVFPHFGLSSALQQRVGSARRPQNES